ncbi:LamB/YcsF family protein [Sporosarcina pasteurii]|uniref:5-oxoprolinase subunit A n=1 Tax=Sporosarcina pasteurii TaxID=1474 RepID=A0A380C704_SPOPA|nr:5-oxoprolinase subunit PxpA [Sporosarcina pasteurii]MDS9473047.1 5-oxoprolinase subunit PxpA [Sporosarcina pasteurii]QBQ04555.1 LamB/YcsF family protein [Sporosarcina pasteurii]SUJ14178.1 LamB/YcsF family protein [Sporosarcina pasteurii]
MTHHRIDLNADIGESFGAYTIGNDKGILPFISSANIACGFHAGDPSIMRKTVTLALQYNVAIGAHPGFQDMISFGRREMKVTPEEVYELTLYQIGALQAFVSAEGGTLQHVKPHGALYNMSAKDARLAEAIARAIYQLNPKLRLYGLANSKLIEAGRKIGLETVTEIFADRTYQRDGSLTPRSHPNALITNTEKAIEQVMQIIKEQQVTTIDGSTIKLQGQTVCIHGDGENAIQFAQQVSAALRKEKISIQNFTQKK